MKILHLSDLHFGPRHLDEINRCVLAAYAAGEDAAPDLVVISGDTFDHRVELHTEAVHAAIGAVVMLAELSPLIILQGTYSHDTPGSLDVFKNTRGAYPIMVADRICQIAVSPGSLLMSEGIAFQDVPDCLALVSCLPTTNKASLIAAGGASEEIGDHVAAVLAGWQKSSIAAREKGVPTALVSHGTVSGSITEHGVPMAGLDHEFTTGSLFASGARAILLGHIHKFQSWSNKEGQVIAYPGSIGRLHFGEADDKGALLWNVTADSAEIEFIKTPARELFEYTFVGVPTAGDIRALASTIDWNSPVHARIRIQVDEEYRGAVDRDLICEVFERAATLRVEVKVNPIQRVRAAGISEAAGTNEMIAKWGEYTGTDAGPLMDRLGIIEADPDATPEEIASRILNEANDQ